MRPPEHAVSSVEGFVRRSILTLLALLTLAAPAAAQEPTVTETLRVPTVDGKEVSVEVTRPASGRAPVILTYSPYNSIGAALGDDVGARYIPKGYVRAIADVLGTRNSSGCWDYGGPKEQQSGVDLVNFLAKQPWSNGKVAMIGGSYDGTTASMVAARSKDAPGLAAIVPEAAISRWYGYAYSNGVRYFLNGKDPSDEGFDTPLAFDFGFGRTPPEDPSNTQAMVDRFNPCNSAEHSQRGYDQSPDYDAFWKERDYRKDASSFRVPTLISHGWQDFNVKQEEATALYEAIDRAPWKGIWLGQYEHGSPGTDEWWTLLDQFFDKFLMGRDSGLPPQGVVVSQPRDAAAAGDPQRLDSWPPPRTEDVELQLGRSADGGVLGPQAGEPASYKDPQISEEQRAQQLDREGGWLTYVSEPAKEDARIAGAPVLDTTVVVDRDAAHLTPTLYDIAEDGTAVPITRGFLNLRYRDGLEKEKTVPAGEPVRAVVEFLPQDWIVRAGHRIGLTVASSNTAWAVPAGQPGLNVEVRHGGASRLLLPLAGAGRAPAANRQPLPQSYRPNEILPSNKQARRTLRVTLRRGRRGTLLVTGRAPSRTSIFLRFRRNGKVYSDRSVRARNGRFTLRIKAKRRGTYRVTAMLRTRQGVVTRKSARVRVR
jgi:X-Pro dipeptidyl-peptidase